MSKNTGTLIGAVIKTADSLDQYPVAEQADVKGGHHSVATIADRDAIGAWLREAGMTCYVVADTNTYELAADLITWTLSKSNSGATTAPGTGGGNLTQLIAGNFGEWTDILNKTAQFFLEDMPLRFKGDLLAFATRAIVYLQGQFGLRYDYVGTSLTLGNLPANYRPPVQLKAYMICKNIEMYLIVETNGDIKLQSKDGFNLPVADNAEVNSEPYYISTFFNPNIAQALPVAPAAPIYANVLANDDGTGGGFVVVGNISRAAAIDIVIVYTYSYTPYIGQDIVNQQDTITIPAGQTTANGFSNGQASNFSATILTTLPGSLPDGTLINF